MPGLFEPIEVGPRSLPNRVVVAPMCQYSAIDGLPTAWHFGHLHDLAISGAGMLMLESTAVTMEGRISKRDLAIYADKHVSGLENLLGSIRDVSDIVVGLQLSHSGRKGSVNVPWERGGRALAPDEGAWQTVSASPERRYRGWPVPREMSIQDISQIIDDFDNATRRAHLAGFDGIEIHMAHGYLLHQFLSPICNRRQDHYGGCIENRCRLPLEIMSRVRTSWPSDRILGARVTGDDWVEGGWSIHDCIVLAQELKNVGVDYVCVSSGGILPKTNLKFGPGYQVHLAERVKKAVNIHTRSAGMIQTPKQADEIIRDQRADLVALGRQFIREPRFMIRAAKELGERPVIPEQYQRILV
jgi:2,4-dienoyl-CoA reductase-like NADH-dependent reductase (Old Yellow Enzyme family)